MKLKQAKIGRKGGQTARTLKLKEARIQAIQKKESKDAQRRYTALVKYSDQLFDNLNRLQPYMVEVYDHLLGRVIYKTWGRNPISLLKNSIEYYGANNCNPTRIYVKKDDKHYEDILDAAVSLDPTK